MDNASGVKAIMAKFNCEGSQPKIADHPPVSSLQPKKAALEKLRAPKTENSLQGNPSKNIQPKPLFPKGSCKSLPGEKNLKEPFPKPKPAINKFNNINTQNEGKVVFPKSQFNGKPSEVQKDNEPKPMFPKPLVPKPTTNLNQPEKEQKSLFLKPPSVSKPPWVTENSQNNDSNTKSTIPPKPPSALKPKPGSFKVHKEQSKDSSVTESTPKAFPGVILKPAGSKSRDPVTNESRDSKFNDNKKEEASTSSNKPIHPQEAFLSKVNQKYGGPPPGPKFISKKPGFQETGSTSEEKKDPSTPKRNTLPNIFALGSPPAKPNRPPNVNLEKFKKGAEFTSAVPNLGINNPIAPSPPPSHPGVQAAPSLPPGTPLPSLPRHHPGAVVQPDPDEMYDDVGTSSPPPLPAGKPRDGYPGNNEDDAIDEEMYEDLEERWSVKESKDEKKREKEEKKRLEQEKKEQKEKERKENGLKKRFKLPCPIEVIHKVKARVDYKGAKNELTVKQGEIIDIIRIAENPEGKWLGRTADGSYGYIKTVSVEIDYDTLKRQQKTALLSSSQRHVTEQDQDVYDDVGQEDDVIRHDPGAGVVLPPPPGEDGIYNDVDDPGLNVSSASQEEPKPSSWSWGLLKILKGKDDKKENVEEHLIPPPTEFSKDKAPAPTDEIYDDVESHDLPPPTPPSSLLKLKADPKKQKKFEREEKEFRKKFKYDGEIQVLHQVTVVPTVTNKKWGGKDLPLKPGEVLDVIQKAVDNKMICRNDEGKFGYVLNNNIIVDDADIYDDIGEGCIYDND
ncbi:FYN-binding protein 1-like isoform X2 [Polyodon spathula]|uniref:FYN-binding protein 1-like isoform X2 n=1 Tax=Polyodon spathula TaxID=7913 RepID=UPI001B7ED033|nr:FYN-binding protein 1-like isoform X2 [Polyodon spathula]